MAAFLLLALAVLSSGEKMRMVEVNEVPGLPGFPPEDIVCRLRDTIRENWGDFWGGELWGNFANTICGANAGHFYYEGETYNCANMPAAWNILNTGNFDLGIVDANPAWVESMDAFVRTAYNFSTVKDATACSHTGWSTLSCPDREPSWGKHPIRGVNLGGWFLLEPWISGISIPWQDDALDEYHLTESLGKEAAQAMMEQHWSSFITPADFNYIASMGLNSVRIPFGHWFFDTEEMLAELPYVRNIVHLENAITWACNADLQVLLDLHGALGSQNGFDNSGREHPRDAPQETQGRGWLWNEEYVAETVATVGRIAEWYTVQNQKCGNIIGIEVLNEPWVDLDAGLINEFYNDAVEAIRAVDADVPIILSDSFRYAVWANLRQYPEPANSIQNKNIYMDAHIYQGFNGADVLAIPETHHAMACGFADVTNWMSCHSYPTMVGEWSLTTNDCTTYINGYNVGGKWGVCPSDVMNDITYSDAWLRTYATRQMNAWEQNLGWFFWTYKVEGDGFGTNVITQETGDRARWSYRKCFEMGWVPDFSFPEKDEIVKRACDNFPSVSPPLFGVKTNATKH